MKNILKKIDRKLWNYKAWQTLTGIPRQAGHVYARIKKVGYEQYRCEVRLKKQAEKAEKAEQKKQAHIEWLMEEKWLLDKNVKRPKNPTASIVMPVYNAEEYLKQTLDSLLAQSLNNIEIITVDDGSTDRSLQILKEYAAADKRVRVYTQKNQYAGVARNLGLKHARGEYVLFLDSDDFFEPELVKETCYAAKVNDADVVMYGANCYNNETGKVWIGRHLLDANYVPEKQPFNCKECPDTIFQISNAVPWTKLFRRKFIKKSGLKFQKIYNANDVFFVFSALSMAERIVTLDKQLVNYRVGLKGNLQSSKRRYFFEAYTALYQGLKNRGMLELLRKSYTNAALNSFMYNLRVVADLEAKKAIFDRLKNETLDALEIPGHEKSYYYNEKNYDEMLLVKNGTFEQYLELQNK